MDEDILCTLTEMEEIHCVINLQKEAEAYLNSFSWCLKTKKSWYEGNYSTYDIIGIFLFEIEPIDESVDDFVWVIVGDIPSLYLDKTITSGREVIEIYCELIEDWIYKVKKGYSLEDSVPVEIEETVENADLLELRIDLIREIFSINK
jgi:hypothetical protein